uniref:SLA-DM alpha chain n=1 Tax=Sus scrofa TaxID=9823 RepID=A0A4X1V2Q5_PIG
MDHELSQGAALLRLLHLLWLLPHSWTAPEAPAPGWRDELQNHTFQYTMYCQDGNPEVGLSEVYDGDQLFSFNFSQNIRVPRLPEFADWAHQIEDTPAIFFDKGFCREMIEKVGPLFEGKIPVSRGLPIAEVFTLKPLEFGKPNTLVCFVSNLFPPALTVTWEHHSAPVEGIGPTFVSATDDLSFQAFSYLNFTPTPSDLFSCVVTHELDGYVAISYWGETLLSWKIGFLGGGAAKKTHGGASFSTRPLFLPLSPPQLSMPQFLPLSPPQLSMPQFLPCHPRHPPLTASPGPPG